REHLGINSLRELSMSFFSWRTWWNRARAKAAAPGQPRLRKFFLEALEDRTLLATYTVTLAGDAGSADPSDSTGLSGDIRYAVTQADQPATAGSTIKFNTARTGPVITLSNGELRVARDMTIRGPGAGNLTISGGSGAASRIFEINSGVTASISGLTLS